MMFFVILVGGHSDGQCLIRTVFVLWGHFLHPQDNPAQDIRPTRGPKQVFTVDCDVPRRQSFTFKCPKDVEFHLETTKRLKLLKMGNSGPFDSKNSLPKNFRCHNPIPVEENLWGPNLRSAVDLSASSNSWAWSSSSLEQKMKKKTMKEGKNEGPKKNKSLNVTIVQSQRGVLKKVLLGWDPPLNLRLSPPQSGGNSEAGGRFRPSEWTPHPEQIRCKQPGEPKNPSGVSIL